MTRREFYWAVILIGLLVTVWYWAGWAAGRARLDTLQELGCRISCGWRT